jgi:hypothetical protein
MGNNVASTAPLQAPSVARDEIEAFFHAYSRALDAWDVDRIARLHHAPCLKIHGDGSIQCLPTHEDVRSFFHDLSEKYRERELHSGSFRDLEVVPIGAQAVLATVTWDLLRIGHSLLRQFRRSYNLYRSGTDWLILVTTAHRE